MPSVWRGNISIGTHWHLQSHRVPTEPEKFSWFPNLLCHVLCTSCFINPRSFFRRNCSICGCIFGVFMGGCEFRVILCQHLRTLSLNPFYKVKNYCNSWVWYYCLESPWNSPKMPIYNPEMYLYSYLFEWLSFWLVYIWQLLPWNQIAKWMC